jgi:PhzF family phenazine biosynthesis protein
MAPGRSPEDLDPRLPPHLASAGMRHLILAARTRERLAALDDDFAALGALMARADWITVALVHAERADRYHARNPFPPGGIVEDPATGAAAAALGGYLRTLGLLPAPPRFTVLQGEDMGRPSRLEVEVPPHGGVRVGGPATRLAGPGT